MGGTQNSFSPQARDGYTPFQMYEKDGQYYQRTSPTPIKLDAESAPKPTYTPINFGGGQQSANRYGPPHKYGTPRKYGTPSSSYRAPATYRNTPAPAYGGGQVSKGGYEAPPPRSYQQPSKYQQPKLSYKAQVPSFDPNNPQEDAVKDPKLKKAAKQLNKQAPPGERLAFINPKEEAVLKALGGSGMTAAGGIPSYKKGDVEAPPPRDYGKETRDTLEAQVELAPELFESEARYRPQYADLERGIMLEQMGLDPNIGLLDAFRQISGAQKDIQYDSTLADINMIGGLGQQFANAVRSADPRAEGLRQSIMGEAEQGLAEGAGGFGEVADYQRQRLQANQDAYEPLMYRAVAGLSEGSEYDALVDEASQARGTNVYDSLVRDAQARRDANPYSELTEQAREDYESGEGLTALESRDLNQRVLEGAAARGMEDSSSTLAEQIGQRLSADRGIRDQRRDAFARALGMQDMYDRIATSDYAQALGQQEGYGDRALNRFTSALGMAEDFGRRMEGDYASALSGRTGLEAALMGDYERSLANQQSARQQGLQNASAAYAMGNFDPLMALTGRSGTAPMMAQQGFGGAGFALDSSPAIFNPESPYAGALAASNQQNIMDARTATAANRAGMFGGLMGGLGSLGGGLLGNANLFK